MDIKYLEEKAKWVRIETLNIHGIAPETRIASSLSPVEILTVLYYGKILKFNSKNPLDENRDRFIVSKGHGVVSLYPILSDLGYFDKSELKKVGQKKALLGGIPDSSIPGFETTNGSLGHGLGVACGVALALKNKGKDEKVFVLLGDGELFEGSVWEAVMFAGEHRLNNLITILDNNKICMLDYCKNVIDLEPIEEKFKVHKWKFERIDGHNIYSLYDSLLKLKNDRSDMPKLLIADTVKGKGIPCLETNPLCHVKVLNPKEIKDTLERWK